MTTPEFASVGEIFDLEAKFDSVIADNVSWLPDIGNWTHEDHEVQQAKLVAELSAQGKSEKNRSQITLSAIKILIALKSRPQSDEGYSNIFFPGNYLQFYPINLKAFTFYSYQTWNDLSMREWVYWLCSNWGVNTHLRVALRKLRGQSQSTFRIRPSDHGLEVISVPAAVFTSPRFYQSLRILKDIGALVEQEKCWATSELGRQLKELSDE